MEKAESDQLRSKAWDNALHAEGTREVFARRFRALRRKTRIRDWLAFAVPILIGFVATTEWLDFDPLLRKVALATLGVAAVLQLLLALWSMIARWDDDLAYCSRAVRDSYDLREAWRRIGQEDVADLALEYQIYLHQQNKIDSHDVQRDITHAEKQIGMRAGLLEFQRACVCGQLPGSRNAPWWPKDRCVICGGN